MAEVGRKGKEESGLVTTFSEDGRRRTEDSRRRDGGVVATPQL